MTIQVHIDKVEIHSGLTDAQAAILQQILDTTTAINTRSIKMAQEIDDLKAAVAAADTVIEGVVVLLNGIAARLAGVTSLADLVPITADIKAHTDALAAAVATVPPDPGAPAPAPVPPPAG